MRRRLNSDSLPHDAPLLIASSSPGGGARLLVAWLAGAAGALAMPPFGVFPALALSLTVAVWLIDGAATGRPTPAPRRCGPPRSPAGRGASAISWPGCGGSARPSWSRPTSSPGLCRSASSACRRLWRLFPAFGFALGAPALVAGRRPSVRARLRADAERMAARPPVHRLSLERARHGAGAERSG